METTALILTTLSIWLRLHKRSQSNSVKDLNSRKLLKRLRNFRRSTQAPVRFQMTLYLRTSTGEASEAMTSLVSTVIKATAEAATLYRSLRSLRIDSRLSMVKTCP